MVSVTVIEQPRVNSNWSSVLIQLDDITELSEIASQSLFQTIKKSALLWHVVILDVRNEISCHVSLLYKISHFMNG